MEDNKTTRWEYQRNYYYKNREQQLLSMYQYYKNNYEDIFDKFEVENEIIEISGPSSPLETKIKSFSNLTNGYEHSCDPDSINYVLLDDEPQIKA